MIVINNLSLHRGHKVLLSGFSAQLKPGQVVVVLGQNGAGKSTLLQSMMGLFAPTAGSITIHDQAVSQYTAQRLANILSWQGELPPSEFGITVWQRLCLAADGQTVPLAHALRTMDLDDLQQRRLADLSSGERQRLEIAATMVRNKPIWLMDEPTAHLDLRHQAVCLQLMRQQASQGRLIITVLHDLQQAAAIADQVILFDGHGAAIMGKAEKLLNAQYLQPVFGVHIHGSGKLLRPDYDGENT